MNVEYDFCIISFFDILGFQNIIEDKSPKEILKILKNFDEESKVEIETFKSLKNIYFSDTVIRMHNLFSKDNLVNRFGILYHEILEIAFIQLNMIMRDGIFIRGSIVLDKIYNDSKYFFGPGVNLAYNLESKKAIYPRVIIEDSIIKLLFDKDYQNSNVTKLITAHKAEDEVEYLNIIIKKSSDGFYFVDYLNVLKYYDEPNCISFLKKHKQLIEDYYNKSKNINNIASKYLWLKRYHNHFISQIPHSYLKTKRYKKKDLIINELDI